MKRQIILLLIVILIFAIISRYWHRQPPVIKLVPFVDPNYVQNPYEAQERLKAQGYYNGKIDGIWGEMTNKAYCDWCGAKEFNRCEKTNPELLENQE